MSRDHDEVIVGSTGDRLRVEYVSSDEMHWPWGLNGPAVQLCEDYRTGRRRAYLAARSRRVRIPWRFARRWKP